MVNIKKGYDIYNAVEDGIDPLVVIRECKEYEFNFRHNNKNNVNIPNDKIVDNINTKSTNNNRRNNMEPNENNFIPFVFLGHDDSKHYFLPFGSNIVKKINFGSFSKSKLLELASLDWWAMKYPNKKNKFDIDKANDWIIRESEKKGYYTIDKMRGCGVWEDNGQIIINNGDKTFDKNGEQINNSATKYHYTKSSKKMGKFDGRTATDEEGKKLLELFMVQGFESDMEAMIMLGWSLIAPFGSVLKWRPHVWITGPSESGKSYILENLIQPLIGPFVHTGSGKDSTPGIYRKLGSDSCPIIIDEMEAGNNRNNKEVIKKMEDKLELARNASSDFSSTITLANQSGGIDKFCIRSCFCFASVVPYLQGKAIESRINICRIKNFYLTKDKIKKSKNIIKTGLMNDPGIFRNRIFQNLESIKKNIDVLTDILMEITGNKRKSDNLAPIFAAIFSIFYDSSKDYDIEKIKTFLNGIVVEQEKEDNSDEDKLLREIFDYTTRLKTNETVSIAELIYDCEFSVGITSDKKDVLKRYGIKFYDDDKSKYLAIACAHRSINDILQHTMYTGRYSDVIKRHSAANPKTHNLRFAGDCKYAVLLDWEKIKNKYFTETSSDEKSLDLFNDVF